MASRSKKNQAERLQRKHLWAEVEAAGAMIEDGEFAGQIDLNRLKSWRANQSA